MRIGQRRKVLEKSEEVGRIETETLVNYETVVMFGREEREVEEYRGVRGEYLGERVNMLGLVSGRGLMMFRFGLCCVELFDLFSFLFFMLVCVHIFFTYY